jgi:hypothetical protein
MGDVWRPLSSGYVEIVSVGACTLVLEIETGMSDNGY